MPPVVLLGPRRVGDGEGRLGLGEGLGEGREGLGDGLEGLGDGLEGLGDGREEDGRGLEGRVGVLGRVGLDLVGEERLVGRDAFLAALIAILSSIRAFISALVPPVVLLGPRRVPVMPTTGDLGLLVLGLLDLVPMRMTMRICISRIVPPVVLPGPRRAIDPILTARRAIMI